jgi:hypothetical protein
MRSEVKIGESAEAACANRLLQDLARGISMISRNNNQEREERNYVTTSEVKTVAAVADGAAVEMAASAAGGVGGFADPEKRESPRGESGGSREPSSLCV